MTTQKEDLPAFMKRRGFVYQGSEIYGGLAGVWEFGHIGKLMKNHLEKTWKDYFLSLDDNFYEIEGSIIMPKLVFEASGHLDNFDDPLAECFKCGTTERADKIIEEKLNRREESATNEELLKILNENNLNCSRCGNKFEKVSTFNMMFPITFGPKGGQTVYLRPETAQTPFLNFKIQHELLRKKLPMGLAVIGKAFRNEISPKNSLIRCREFEQAELQIFFNPKDINEEKISDTTNFSDIKDEKIIVMLQNKRDGSLKEMSPQELVKYGLPKFYVYYMAKVQNYILNILNIPKDKFRFYELNDKEKAFYNKNHFDLEFFSKELSDWIEIGGVHYRTDHDLGGHEKVSKTRLSVLDEETKERFMPHVLELSFGHWRHFYMLLEQHLRYDEKKENNMLKIPKKLAPIKASVFPLLNKPEFQSIAREIHNDLTENDIISSFDKSGSIGKRYARADEIGTPYCITADHDTLETGIVTIRDRDTTSQIKIHKDKVSETIRNLINDKIEFSKVV
jgi:glycyl-tRNA synthetase